MSTKVIGTFRAGDYVVFAAMLLISAGIGIYYAFAGGGQKTASEFLMGGRKMTALPVALSLTASFMSAVTVLGTPAEIYRYGTMFTMFAFAYTLVALITSEIFLPVFYRLGITSTYEYLELRFSRGVRLFGSIFFLIQTTLYTGIVIYAPALALNQVTGLNLWGAVIITGIVCTFYCTMGGLKAVVWTDVFQVGIMVAGFSSIIIRSVVVQGGIRNIINDARQGKRLNFWDFNLNPLQRHSFWTIVIGGTFTWLSIYGVNQSQVQRYIACKSRFHAKMSLYMNVVGLWTILTCVVLCGLCLYSVYKDCDPWTAKYISAPDQLMPYLALDIFEDYPGFPGLFVACAFSGTLSTVSSSINALAAVTVEDLIKPYFKTLDEKTLSWTSKGMSLVYGVVCIIMAGLASQMGGLLQAALSLFGIMGGPLLGLFTLGILFHCGNSKGAISGLIAGFLTALWIGVGAYVYPPLPARRKALNLSIAGCDKSTLKPVTPSPHRARPAIADYWYSVSYLYFSTIGAVVAVGVGVGVSLLTGGKEQTINRNYLLRKEGFSIKFFTPSAETIVENTEVLSVTPNPASDHGTENPAFSNVEMELKEQASKVHM